MWQRVIKGSLKVKLKFGVPKDTCGEGLFKERPENLNYGKKPIVEVRTPWAHQGQKKKSSLLPGTQRVQWWEAVGV